MKQINSINNEYIKELYKLKNKKYRDEKGLFVVEGYHLVQEAKDKLVTVLISNERDEIKGVENILVTDEIIKKLAFSQNPQKIIGVCEMVNNYKDLGERILLLDNIQDPGNLGTIIRTSLGFGINTIIASLDTVDIYNDKVIRASQGAIFNINYIKGDLKKYIDILKKKDIKIYGTSLKSSVNLKDVEVNNKYAIVLGNEGNGVREYILDLTDVNVRIEMNKQLESLNVAIAGSIIMYHFYK